MERKISDIRISYKQINEYSKFLYTKVSDKMAYVNSVDPDQSAPEGAVW